MCAGAAGSVWWFRSYGVWTCALGLQHFNNMFSTSSVIHDLQVERDDGGRAQDALGELQGGGDHAARVEAAGRAPGE